MNSDKSAFCKGLKDAIPVFVGYFGVAIAIGINSIDAGLTPFQATLMSFTNLTSAGQAVALNIISENGSYSEIFFSQLVINLRYLLMGAALSIKLKEEIKTGTRFLFSYGITDEVFGLSAAQDNPLSPWYTIGCWLMALPGWVLGTLIGALLGNVLPSTILEALSMGLYSMFIAIILPKGKVDKTIALLIVISMILGYFAYRIFPVLSSGNRVILLTITISVAAALLKPVSDIEEVKTNE